MLNILTYRWRHFERGFYKLNNFMMLKYLIQTSIFRYSKNYGSLTHETRIKDAVNMGDLICLLATVRTLKDIWKPTVVNIGVKIILMIAITGFAFLLSIRKSSH